MELPRTVERSLSRSARCIPPASRSLLVLAIAIVAVGLDATAARAAVACRAGDLALSDAKAIAGVRGAIARRCPCQAFDGSSAGTHHTTFVKCASAVVADATDGTPVLGAFTLRRECRSAVRQIYARAACGYPASAPRVMCCEATPSRSASPPASPARASAQPLDHG